MAPAGACPAHPDLPAADSEPVRRFLAGLEKIWPEGFERPDARLGLAVSGGPDSCALLLLAASALPGRIAAATVDHGLRAESADEARFVAELCAALEVPHSIDRVTVGAGNVQAQARTARGVGRLLRGIATEGRRPPRADCDVLIDGVPAGVVTSGNFSPVREHGIALAFLPPDVEVGTDVTIDVRGTALPGRVVELPFVAKN